MSANVVPAAVQRLRDLLNKIRTRQALTEGEAYEFFYLTPGDTIEGSGDVVPSERSGVAPLIHRLQNGPWLTEHEINDALRKRRIIFAKSVVQFVYRSIVAGVRRRDRSAAPDAAEQIVLTASDDEDPDIVRERAYEAARGVVAALHQEYAALEAGLQAPAQGVNQMEVHNEAKKFADIIPLIAALIKEDLGATPQYPGFVEHFDATIGKCVRESQLFEARPGPNSTAVKSNNKSKPKVFLAPKVRHREEWIRDYERIKDKMGLAVSCISPVQASLIDNILDFVFKYKLEECFVPTFLYDAAHAYEGNRGHSANESSCAVGAAERIYLTLFNCIKGMNEGVFGKLNKILDAVQATTWDELDQAVKDSFKNEYTNFVDTWAQSKMNDSQVKSMTHQQRNEAVLAAFKQARGVAALPPFVEGFLRRDYFPYYIEDGWLNLGFEDGPGLGGGGSSQGGRRTRHKKRRNKKTHRKNKNKKSLRRR